MPTSFESRADIALFKTSYRKFVSAGEKQTSDGFKFSIEGYPDIEVLVQMGNIPPMKREPIEMHGPMGVGFVQQGRPVNIHEVPITFMETVKGTVLKTLKDLVVNKKYVTCILEVVSETNPTGEEWQKIKMEDSWLESENIEFSTDDNTPLKPTATIHCNWPSFLS